MDIATKSKQSCKNTLNQVLQGFNIQLTLENCASKPSQLMVKTTQGVKETEILMCIIKFWILKEAQKIWLWT